jgi:autotransporter-associated beta strand protein
VVEIQMTQDANGFINAIHVATNLTVGRFTGMGYGDFNSYRVTIGPGAELAVGKVDTNAFSTSYLPEVYGSGTLRKRGDQMVTLRGAPSFTGSLLVEEGTLSINWATLNTATHLVVSSGAVCSIGGAGIQPRMTLNGSGLAGTGALRILDNNHTRSTRTTIASDSVMSIGTSYKLTHNGPLDGGGVMTLLGGGTLDLNGVWTFSSTNGPGNGISVRDGVVDIAGCTLTFTNLASTMAGEYVVIDYNWPNGSVVGEFVATNGLNARWRLARTGTKTYTNAVVLAFVPPSGSNFIVR